MAIKMKDLVLCISNYTVDLEIETNCDSTMVQALMIDIIKKYQSTFSSRVNTFSQSIGRDMIVDW